MLTLFEACRITRAYRDSEDLSDIHLFLDACWALERVDVLVSQTLDYRPPMVVVPVFDEEPDPDPYSLVIG